MLAGLKDSWEQLLHEAKKKEKKANRHNQKLYSLCYRRVKTDPTAMTIVTYYQIRYTLCLICSVFLSLMFVSVRGLTFFSLPYLGE